MSSDAIGTDTLHALMSLVATGQSGPAASAEGGVPGAVLTQAAGPCPAVRARSVSGMCVHLRDALES